MVKIPAVSKEQFRKIMMLCDQGKMSKQDCADYKKTNYQSLPEHKSSSDLNFDNLPQKHAMVNYEVKS